MKALVRRSTSWFSGTSIRYLTLAFFLLFGAGVAAAQPVAYVANESSNTVSVIDTATNLVTATAPVGTAPRRVAATPDGAFVHVTNWFSNNVPVLESGETTSVGSSISATTNTSSALRVGDNNQDRQYRTVVSFDTSSIPDGATIVSATLRLLRGSLTGTNPFTAHGTCWVDVQNGSGFSGSTALQTGDFVVTYH